MGIPVFYLTQLDFDVNNSSFLKEYISETGGEISSTLVLRYQYYNEDVSWESPLPSCRAS
jgi:hypothetical protein